MRSPSLAHFRCIFGVSCKIVLASSFDVIRFVFWNPLEDFCEEKFYRGILCSINFLTGEFSLGSLSASGFVPSDLEPSAAWDFLFNYVDFWLDENPF
jgi:hypothetical protein